MNGPFARDPRPLVPSIRLVHVGLIVHRIDAALTLYRRFGLSDTARVEFPQEGIRIAFIPVENRGSGGATASTAETVMNGRARTEDGPRLEVMEPLERTGPLYRFLASRGEGIHHLALEVPDLDAALARVREAGGRLIDQMSRQGSEGTRVAFAHPTSTHGVLIELVERRGSHSSTGIDLP